MDLRYLESAKVGRNSSSSADDMTGHLGRAFDIVILDNLFAHLLLRRGDEVCLASSGRVASFRHSCG